MVKNLPASAGDMTELSSIPGMGRSPGGGHGSPLQYSCLENPHGQRSLGGYHPWGHKELNTTEATYSSHTITYVIPTKQNKKEAFFNGFHRDQNLYVVSRTP